MSEVFGWVGLIFAIGMVPIVVIEGWRIFTGRCGMCSMPIPPPVPPAPDYKERI